MRVLCRSELRCATHSARAGISNVRNTVVSAANVDATSAPPVEPGSLVLVAGATGGVGQITCAKLVERGYRVRAIARSAAKVQERLGDLADQMEIAEGDLRDAAFLSKCMEGVSAVICSIGTTAFPSARWGDNKEDGPEQTDLVAASAVINATPPGTRFVFVTSAGVERYKQLGPFMILNAFGVLKYKAMSEEKLVGSGLPYTIFRPSRLTDGPYTSYDLNTLIKGKSGSRKAVVLSGQDDLRGETSRVVVAEACVRALTLPASTVGRKFAIESVEGESPATDEAWEKKFSDV
ncbi:unnamed protein product [Pedinophyceae sp. YPF-701]|nr:unnamed protein product [Pedinophyceae sp. YPF-701]